MAAAAMPAVAGGYRVDDANGQAPASMTRANNHLDLLVPQRFYVSSQRSYGDRHMYASRSRFLPDGILPFFQCRSWPTAEQEAISPTMGSKVCVDIGARLRARWR